MLKLHMVVLGEVQRYCQPKSTICSIRGPYHVILEQWLIIFHYVNHWSLKSIPGDLCIDNNDELLWSKYTDNSDKESMVQYPLSVMQYSDTLKCSSYTLITYSLYFLMKYHFGYTVEPLLTDTPNSEHLRPIDIWPLYQLIFPYK